MILHFLIMLMQFLFRSAFVDLFLGWFYICVLCADLQLFDLLSRVNEWIVAFGRMMYAKQPLRCPLVYV